MSVTYVVIVSIVAGLVAGWAAGIAGVSAAMVISPVLIVFFDIPPYSAIAISLTVDVCSSVASSITYGRKRCINLHDGVILLVVALVFTIIGSFLSAYVPGGVLTGGIIVITLLMGVRFIFFPQAHLSESVSFERKRAVTLFCGALVGLVCGTFGAGGGMMFVIVLTLVLGYDLKKALGTSVLIMACTAAVGALSHFVVTGFASIPILVICAATAIVGAKVAAIVATRSSVSLLNRLIGILFFGLGVIFVLVEYVL